MKVSVIIPAYNEGARIQKVISAVKKAVLPSETVVVSDGSTDDTVEIASAEGINVVELPQNQGKGAAMKAGVSSTDAEIYVFIDADLVGLTPEHVDSLIRPILEGEADATLGVFGGGRVTTDIAQKMTPGLSGQRALKAEFLKNLPGIEESGFGVEVVLNKHLERQHARVKRVELQGVSQILKEEKMGGLEGLAARIKMYKDIVTHMK
ncbi:MAG: glycosyltransferase family 2 protein [Firmicutes bacterium]|nr:glycosyltransferase family 2 protein [Bacillota bacterium]